MNLTADSAFDHLTRIVQTIGHDRELRRWFTRLAAEPAVRRRDQVYSMAERMEADGEDQELVACFCLLADQRVFEAARLALQECR